MQLQHLDIGMANIQRAAKKLTLEECKKFARSMIDYLNKTWMSKDRSTWNVFMVRTRTNNNAEAGVYISVTPSNILFCSHCDTLCNF